MSQLIPFPDARTAASRAVASPLPGPAPEADLARVAALASLPPNRHQRVYDHRLRRLVFESQDVAFALELGVPRSTAAGWLRTEPPEVVTVDVFDAERARLIQESLKLRRKERTLRALCRLLLTALRLGSGRLASTRLPGETRSALVHAVERARTSLPLRSLLVILGLSASCYHAWAREDALCKADNTETCLQRTPNQLTPAEVNAIREMVTSPAFRHVSVGRLALLAQRLGTVFAATSTWCRLIRDHGWRRPRARIHPKSPRVGLRTTHPNQAWHVDVTLIRLLDGTRLYLHGVIDNYSRKILSWSTATRLEAATCAAVLRDAIAVAGGNKPAMLVGEGCENYAKAVDELVNEHLLRRLRAQSTELRFSNSPIEAFWSSLKHQWLFLNNLDTRTKVEKLTAFFVQAHNAELPHSAFAGQTPDEMYTGTGNAVPEELAAARTIARAARLEANRALTCASCPRSRPPESAAETPAA